MHTAKRNAYRPFDEISTIPPYRFQLPSQNHRNACRETCGPAPGRTWRTRTHATQTSRTDSRPPTRTARAGARRPARQARTANPQARCRKPRAIPRAPRTAGRPPDSTPNARGIARHAQQARPPGEPARSSHARAAQRCTPRQRLPTRQHDDPRSSVGRSPRPVPPLEHIGYTRRKACAFALIPRIDSLRQAFRLTNPRVTIS